MIFSYKELKRLSNLDNSITLQDMTDAINTIGFEVEGIEKFASVEGIKFGKIQKIYKNPDADGMNVCEIKFDDKIRIIQTTADNVYENMIVVAFIPGSRIDDTIFEEKKLKGIISEGMLSSMNEFNIKKDLLRNGAVDGIQEYDEFSIEHDPIKELVLDDILIDVDILTNRSDANSYYIMAKELAAYFNTKPIHIEVKTHNIPWTRKVEHGEHKELVLIEATGNIKISKKDMIFLTKHKVKTISDATDLTNLTLLMTGQPTHVYDANKVGNIFGTKLSSEKEIILGKKEVELKDSLVITSDDKNISLAGVMGFENSKVDFNTKNFIFEMGQFNTNHIRKSIKKIKISSNSGIQSSKELTFGSLKLAIEYISSKLSNFSSPINFYNKKNKIVYFDFNKLNRVAGFDISKTDKFKSVIKSLIILGFEYYETYFTIPSNRHDISTQQDLNEEILRFYGYDNLVAKKPKTIFTKTSSKSNIKYILSSKGYYEVMTYSLISKEKNIFNPFSFKNTISLQTFISKEREVIRNSQLYSLIEVFEYNNKRNINDISIFSIGMINSGIKAVSLLTNSKNFYEVKKDILGLINKEVEFVKTTDLNLHPNYAADILLDNKKIGYIGKVNPKINQGEFIVSEIILPLKSKLSFNSYSKLPLKHRDITFELSNKEYINDFIKEIKCESIEVIDIFEIDEKIKKTLRFYGTSEMIKKIDKKFNK